MKTPVNDIVSKSWANKARELLTGSYPDITSLFTGLLTLQNAECERLKSMSARERVEIATKALMDWIKYGWAFGMNGDPTFVPRRPQRIKGSRRLGVLCRLGSACGMGVGRKQAERIARAHTRQPMIASCHAIVHDATP